MTPTLTGLRTRLSACRGVLVDSNVLLDIATNDPNWSVWSGRALAECAEYAVLIINAIIYAEVSIRYTTIETLDAALPQTLYQREPLPWEAGFLAGRCFLQYRHRGGVRSSPLPDFILARALQPAASPSSRVMLRGITPIFRNLRSSLPLPR